MRLLLINPKFQESFWSLQLITQKIIPRAQYTVAPLGLASLAALCPGHWEVTIIDENVEDMVWDFPADVVGVGGMSNQNARQKQILEHFRSRGCYTVAGGNHASLVPEDYEEFCDTVVAGEAEYIWPEFCGDLEKGCPKPLYRETGNVELSDCPTPRFDLLHLDRYLNTALQFSRGCPFRCEFCDIIVVFGRKPRTKSPEQIGAELDALRAQGVRNVFFVDDNLIGHKPKCKELLQYLIEYQKRHNYRFFFGTEASMNLAADTELLDLFCEANFGWVFVGIESPSEESLQETLKFQNTGMDLLESVHTLHRRGIEVRGGFIVGFDADDETIFERQFQFIQESGISLPMVGLLVAIVKTPLYERLQEAGRLVYQPSLTDGGDNTKPVTNVVPLKMTYEQLIDGHSKLICSLFEDEAIYHRICNKFQHLGTPIPGFYVRPFSLLPTFFRFLYWVILRGGPRRWYFFLKTLPLAGFSILRFTALADSWTMSVALRQFIDRHFTDQLSR